MNIKIILQPVTRFGFLLTAHFMPNIYNFLNAFLFVAFICMTSQVVRKWMQSFGGDHWIPQKW
jgi:hypothetical protein